MKRSASSVLPTPDGPISSVESPRGMPPPIAASSFGEPEARARRPASATCRARSSRDEETPRTRRSPIRKLCWPATSLCAAHLQHAQPAPVDRAVRLVLELDDAVRDRELRLACASRPRSTRRPGSARRRCRRPCSRGRRSRAGSSSGSTTSCSALLLSITITDGFALEAAAQDLVACAGRVPRRRRSISSARWTNSTRSPSASASKNANGDEMPHELLVRLRPGRVVERLALGGRVREADLLREDRLAAARRPRRGRSARLRQAAAENQVEPRVAGREQRRHAVPPRASRTQSTRAAGSNGLRKKTSASVRCSEPGLELMRMIGISFVTGFSS